MNRDSTGTRIRNAGKLLIDHALSSLSMILFPPEGNVRKDFD
jgi:hypothetical protein